ncbi:hypothetical protein [Sphingomonas sp. BK036]|uniref:hypothetical protein n=1 Tax=Sphingomonas sp. BK036 TaxID=2512122 RepID=UPI001A935A23|nr:hypothetical protein [Sphingomonas sp. BK036]
MTSGYVTIAGTASLGCVDISGSRLVKSLVCRLSGSTVRAAQITVRSGATFGAAGSVIGNIAVAGTLSPGVSPGTMTVTGNVSLLGGSVSLFGIAPTVADKLVINGGLSIASGATLRIVAGGAIRPGTSYDLIVASGGIAGTYTTITRRRRCSASSSSVPTGSSCSASASAIRRSARRSCAASTTPMPRSRCSL